MRACFCLLIVAQVLIPVVSLAAPSTTEVPVSFATSTHLVGSQRFVCFNDSLDAPHFARIHQTDTNAEAIAVYQVSSATTAIQRLSSKIRNLKLRISASPTNVISLRNKLRRLKGQRKEISSLNSRCLTGEDLSLEADPPPSCGDNVLDLDEACDDGDTDSGDGCSRLCQIEAGWSCDPSGCAINNIQSLSDEFSASGTLNDWNIFDSGPFSANYYETLNINQSIPGALVLVPGPNHSGWYGDGKGPMLSKLITGDFLVEVYLTVRNKNDLSLYPTEDYNSAGIIARDPNTELENYVISNLGFQSHAVGMGTEAKTTVNSVSTLYLHPSVNEGRIRLCRVGDDFRILRRLIDEGSWTETNLITRSDLPTTVQVGMMANGWAMNESLTAFDDPPNTHATFDYIRFYLPMNAGECAQEF